MDVYGIVLPTFDISIDNEADRLTNITYQAGGNHLLVYIGRLHGVIWSAVQVMYR